jgi:hypothetical protein
MSDLKPCPFCGGSPELDGKSDDVRVRCEDGCGALGQIFFFDGEDYEAIELASTAARESWNRRASPPAEAQEIERLRAALNDIVNSLIAATSVIEIECVNSRFDVSSAPTVEEFDQEMEVSKILAGMVDDYKASIERARAALAGTKEGSGG